jgi:pimeloyl-[acyl-carrier protein] methyl ester esterase
VNLPLVLLPGLDGTGDLFNAFAAAAPPQFEPLIVRFPPLGTYAELLAYVRSQLPRDQPFAVLGESFSGPLAMAIAREERDRVTEVILCNSFVAPPITPLLRFLPWSLLFLVPPPRWVVRWLFVGIRAPQELVDAVRAAVAKTPRKVLAQRMRSVFGLSRTEPPLDTRVLVLSSTADLLVRPRNLGHLASAVVTRRIAGPHLLLQAAPREAWAEISDFLLHARIGT